MLSERRISRSGCSGMRCAHSLSAPNSLCSLSISFIPAGLRSGRDSCKQGRRKLLKLQKGRATHGSAFDSSSYSCNLH